MFAPEIKIEKFEMVDVITTSSCTDDEEFATYNAEMFCI